MSDGVFLDTSALAKWYLHETHSSEVAAFIRKRGPVFVSSLTQVEMRSLVARRRRAGEITPDVEMEVLATFDEDTRRGFLVSRPLSDGVVAAARNLISSLPAHPLRSLDALHLATAREMGADVIATADRVMADAAAALGFRVERF